jgi:phospholipase A-2-activating protein
LNTLSTAAAYLKSPSGSCDEAGIIAVLKLSSQWPIEKRFPALDLLRLFALYAPQQLAAAIPKQDIVGFIVEASGLLAGGSETNAMLAYRGLANLFSQEAGRQHIWEKRNVVLDVMQVDVSGKYKGKNARLAASTLAVK